MQADKKNHRFRQGSTFVTVVDRYNFDRELRLITLDMVERIEVALRTRLIYHLSLAYGSHWFENMSLVKSKPNLQKALMQIKRECN